MPPGRRVRRLPRGPPPYAPSPAEVDASWRILDASGQGVVGAEELTAACRALGQEHLLASTSPADMIAFACGQLREGEDEKAEEARSALLRSDFRDVARALRREAAPPKAEPRGGKGAKGRGGRTGGRGGRGGEGAGARRDAGAEGGERTRKRRRTGAEAETDRKEGEGKATAGEERKGKGKATAGEREGEGEGGERDGLVWGDDAEIEEI